MNIPNHVAIILDGNGRWAKSKGMPRNYGHVKGAQNLEVICRDAYNMGIKYLTVYLFSTENWKRSPDEVDALMKLFRRYTKTCIRTARDNNMKVRVLGDPTALADDLQESLKKLVESSKDNTGLNFQIAINYGSRDEIVRAIRKVAADYGGALLGLSGYCGGAGSGPSDPYKRRAASFKLSALAAGLYGVLFYRGTVAGIYEGGAGEGDRKIQQQRPQIWRCKGGINDVSDETDQRNRAGADRARGHHYRRAGAGCDAFYHIGDRSV